MSIKLITEVWFGPLEDRAQVAVLLALANFANDEGECWPAVETVAKMARVSGRTVRRICQSLEESGYLVRKGVGGRGKTNRYYICTNPDTVSAFINPDISDTKTRTSETQTRTKPPVKADTAMSTEPIEPSKNRKGNLSLFPDFVSEEAAAGFIEHRRVSRKPLSDRAIALLGTRLQEIQDQGGDASAALDMATANGWHSIEPEWYWKRTGRKPGVVADLTPERRAELLAKREAEATEEERQRVSKEDAARIMRDVGIRPRKFK